VVEAKKPLIILATLITRLILFDVSDSVISIADTGNSNNEVTSNETNNSSAGTTITITMTRVLDD